MPHSSEKHLLDFDSGHCILGTFLDVAKAFDSLDRRILVEKLENHGIRGIALEWINTQQYVNYNKIKSDVLSIDYGVPHGRKVGPILLILFISDLVLSAPHAHLVCLV